MTAKNDLDRTLDAWLGAEAAPAPPEQPLARVIETTRGRRSRPSRVAGFGSHWVSGSAGGVLGGRSTLRPALIIGLVALIALALAGSALLVGGRLQAPPLPHGRTYLNELVAAPDLSQPVLSPLLVPLADGRVLVVDRADQSPEAVLYDPATGTSVTANPMLSADPLYITSAVQLQDGRVLILGDTSVQVFDPATLSFAPVGPTVTPRSDGNAALLRDGRVLITGGASPIDQSPVLQAELFDPGTLTFSPTGSVGIVNPGGTVSLPDGRVFVAEGPGDHPETHDPSTGTFSAASTMSGVGGRPVALPDGRVVMVGSTGLYSGGTVETWNPGTSTVSWISLPEPLTGATALDDGRVLIIGMCRGRPTGWTGLFDPSTVVTAPGPTTEVCRPASTRLADGRVLIAGGDIGDLHAAPTVQIFR